MNTVTEPEPTHRLRRQPVRRIRKWFHDALFAVLFLGAFGHLVNPTSTVNYTYKTTGSDGAGQTASVDGALGSDTITYSYDDLGRLTSHAVNGTGESVTFDALGRIATVTNPLDSYALSYSASTSLLTAITGSSSFVISNTYAGVSGDYRLLGTEYTWSGTQDRGDFGYQYDAGGRITQWDIQTGGAAARRLLPRYDPVSRLTSALTVDPATGTQLAADAYQYDRVGNRLGEQHGLMVSSGSFNALNQLLGISAGGNAMFTGSLSEPGTVATGSVSVRTDGSNNFALSLPVTTGTNAFTLVSTDVNGNATTNTATVVIPTAGNRSYTYDLNGNLTNDGLKTYEWDEADRLTAINYTGTTTRTQFTYDGQGRRVEIKELNSGTTVSDTKYVWDGMSIAEARASDGTTVQKRYYGGGFQLTGTGNYYYIKDHLGSIREVFDGTGAERGQWSYDVFGNRSLNAITSSPVDSDFGYTGLFEHEPSALLLALYRTYDPSIGRWLSRDPLGEDGGATLYSYVWNDPINGVDPAGLLGVPPPMVLTPIIRSSAMVVGGGLGVVGTGGLAALAVGVSILDDTAVAANQSVTYSEWWGDLIFNTFMKQQASGPPIGPPKTPQAPPGFPGDECEKHHRLPQEFKAWFEASPRNLNIEDYTQEMPRQWHRGQEIGIHSQGYNAAWREFIRANPGATGPQTIQFMNQLESSMGFAP